MGIGVSGEVCGRVVWRGEEMIGVVESRDAVEGVGVPRDVFAGFGGLLFVCEGLCVCR
jgi:hypothetical protein